MLFKITMDIKEGILTVTSRLCAVFVGAIYKAIERPILKPNLSFSIEETPYKERPVPFYNWLEERDVIFKQY